MKNHLDPHEQNRRSQYLQALARLDGRDDPAHPKHGTFSGLYLARVRHLVEQDMTFWLGATDVSRLTECHPARGQVTVV